MKFILLSLLVFGTHLAVVGQHKQIIKLATALPTAYPFSPGVVSNGLLFVSGQVGTDPKTGKLVPGGIETETAQTIQNIRLILETAGASTDDVVSVTVYLSNMDDFAAMNTVYRRFFTDGNFPARTTVGVAKLVFGAAVEMTMTVAMPRK